jgi:flagellum-specific peptidoglycan hydrolase FlgJ
MASQQQIDALKRVFAAAMESACLFPQAQACEVMVETTWLTSELGVQDNNLFGMKQHEHPIFGTVNLPTKEFLHGGWTTVTGSFVVYPTMADCFADRMATLERLAALTLPATGVLAYPHYAAALKASTPEEFLTQVSLTWSTGPTRGQQCVEILHAHEDVLA